MHERWITSRRVLAIAALLTLLSLTSVHTVQAQRASIGSILYLQASRDSQLPDYYQLNERTGGPDTLIHPRAYWITPTYQATTFASGTWTLSVTVKVTVIPSINVYSLAVLSSTGAWLQTIGVGAVSHRYNQAGTYRDTITFSSPVVFLRNERLEVYYMTPNWCTAAPILLGGNTYLTPPPQTVRASQRV